MSSNRGWTGAKSRKARAYWFARLQAEDLPCSRCGEPVQVLDNWQVDHLTALAEGGDLDDPDNLWPAHASCNARHGQRLSVARKGTARTRRREPKGRVFDTAPEPSRVRHSHVPPDLARDVECQPLHLSPTDQVDLAPMHSGAAAIGLVPKPQQVQVAEVLLSGQYRRVAVCEPRRCGKTTGIWSVIVGICLERPGTLVAFTAQSQLKAGDRFRDLVDRLTRAGTKGWSPRYAAGRQAVLFDNTSRIDIRAPKGDSFRGDEADVVWIDEGQELDLATSQDLLGAVLPLFDTRPQALLIVSGTAGLTREGLLWSELERGRNGKGGIVEYAATDDADQDDPQVWLATHPGLAHGMTTLEIVAERHDDLDRINFGREYLGIWPSARASSIIDPEQFATLALRDAVPPEDGSVVLAWEAVPDGSAATLWAAWKVHETDDVIVREMRSGEGTLWVARATADLVRSLKAKVVYDPIGTGLDIAAQLTRLRTPRVDALRGSDLKGGYANLVERIATSRLHYVDNDALVLAVSEAERRPYGESWLWKRTPNAAPLVAVTHAAWVAASTKKRERTRIRTATNNP